MSDVLAFLAAVHAADEQAARAADDGGDWSVRDPDTGDDPEGAVYSYRAPVAVYVECNPPRGLAEPDAVHIARHDPQSVLARVEAERRLCETYAAAVARKGAAWLDYCSWVDGDPSDRPAGGVPDGPSETVIAGLEVALRALAWGYRGREGWRAEWAPDEVEVGA